MADSPRNQFLSNLAKWEHSIPLTSQWIVRITPQNNSLDALYNAISNGIKIDNPQFSVPKNLMFSIFSNPGGATNNDVLGCYYAQEVGLPQESFNVIDAPIQNAGGFLTGIAGSDRINNTQRSFNISFLETNTDFADGIIKPWIITASYAGLLERTDKTNIKANIDVLQYTKNKKDITRPVRKMHHFYGCVPRQIQAPPPLKYTEASDVNIMNVDWSYNSYKYELLTHNV